MTHHIRREILPFTAIVGQDTMKKALILNAINPRIGGVLIRGEKGTAKSTAVCALAEQARAKGIYVAVIDTEILSDSFIQMQLGYCRAIASYSGGKYYPIADLTSGAVRDIVIRERNMLNDLQTVVG